MRFSGTYNKIYTVDDINGVECYTREFKSASETSIWKHGYCIEIWAEDAPAGTTFTDLNNNKLETTVCEGQMLYKVPTEVRVTTLNDNGSEYFGQFKICMPVRATPESGTATIRATSSVSRFDLYPANNTNQTEQSYIIADPGYASVRTAGALTWKKVVTPCGKLILRRVDGYGQPLAGAVIRISSLS